MEQHHKMISLILIFLIAPRLSHGIAGNPTSYKIGGVLSNNASRVHFKQTIEVK